MVLSAYLQVYMGVDKKYNGLVGLYRITPYII